MAVTLITKAAYARHRGCDEKAVRKAIAESRITPIGKLIDPAVADIQWAQNTRARASVSTPASMPESASAPADGTSSSTMARDAAAAQAPPGIQTPSTSADAGDYQAHRTRRELAEAERAELETARLAGRLVDRELAERVVFESFRELRDATFAAAKSQARRVQGLTEIREIELALEDELRDAFGEWEQRMQRRLAEAAAA